MESPNQPRHPGPLVGGPSPRAQRSRRGSSRVTGALFSFVAPIIVLLFRSLWASYRFRVVDEEPVHKLVADGQPLILTCWHESVFVMAWYTLRLTRMGANVAYLVSPSRDGDLVVRVLDVIGATVVRGSATRSGVKALHGIYRAIRRNNSSPLMLSDGPQGPAHVCKPGSILLARLSGARILPMGSWPQRSIRLRTWDRLFVPLPTSRVAVVVGEPYLVPGEMDGEAIEKERLMLQKRLVDLTERARCEASGR